MRDRLLQVILLAMVFVEALRGGSEIWSHIRRAREKAKLKGNSAGSRLPPWMSHSREWAVLAVVCGLAMVPTFYYGAHAVLI